MIGISKLYCEGQAFGDAIRYGENSGAPAGRRHAHIVPKTAQERRPVVVWNCTRICNLKCIHCYTDSECRKYEGELTLDEAREMMIDLAEFKIPALLFSGGEPLVRPDLFKLAEFGKQLGLRLTISTNGTLITEDVAAKIKDTGFAYVGISLDGIEEVNDRFRGKKGAFKRAVAGFRNCKKVGQTVGLRLTLTRHNYENLCRIFDFIESEGIDRACFYHLAYAGRGHNIYEDDLSYAETRHAMDIILERTENFYNHGLKKEILTVDNHVDGIYLYMKLLKKNPKGAEDVLKLLKWNGGGAYSSGVGIGDIDFSGNVHADQFWMHYSLGNVRERKFSEIWTAVSDPLMAGLKNRLPLLKGKCSKCKWQKACGGSLRARADAVYNDPWAPDPACYLTDEEIGLTEDDKKELKERGEAFEPPAVFQRSSTFQRG